MQDNQYIFAVARTRVLETKLLNDAFIEQLISAGDAEQCEKLLQEKGWDTDLTKESDKIWDTVQELHVPMNIFDVLTLPYLYHNLKAGIKEIASPDDHPYAFYENIAIGREEMLKILGEKNFRALPEHMQEVASKAYDTFLHTQDGQMCDVMVDRASLDAIRKAGNASKDKVVRDYARTIVTVTDIKIAIRAAETGKDEEFARKALAECDGLDVGGLAKAVAGGTERVMEHLRQSSFEEAVDEFTKSPSSFERWCDNATIRAMKPQKSNPFTVGPLFAYVIGRQNEIKTVRIILSGKANGLSNDSIRERVREMYG